MRRARHRLLNTYLRGSPVYLVTRMSSTMNGHTNGQVTWPGVTLSELPKSHTFTAHLPPDPTIPTPEVSMEASPQRLRSSRLVKEALFTWVAPEHNENPQLLATSWKALRDLGLKPEEAETEEFLALMSGNKIYEDLYPWGSPS
jgi:hypothetical protein